MQISFHDQDSHENLPWLIVLIKYPSSYFCLFVVDKTFFERNGTRTAHSNHTFLILYLMKLALCVCLALVSSCFYVNAY